MPALARLIDANGNRAAEGLRVLEDIARFLLADTSLAKRSKDLRHELRARLPATAVAARDTAGDVGTTIVASDEGQRRNANDLIRANAARVGEALRVLEEAGKLDGGTLAACEGLRYRCYDLERDLLAQLPSERLRGVRLCALADLSLCRDADHLLAVAVAVAKGGAGMVQLRAKHLSARAYRDLAARVMEAVAPSGALFAVNDHAAVAATLAAPVLHLGQDDLTLADARRVVGPLCAIGVSVHELRHLQVAQRDGSDYVGLGPMFATATKPHEIAQGPALLTAVQPFITVPSFAIGGLDPERISALRIQIPHGIAVAGYLCRAQDPERAAAECLASLCPDISGAEADQVHLS